MASEHRMIEPYEPGQVKQVDGKRIVSYGTSSYGYDIRCADEFKLFTNINSNIGQNVIQASIFPENAASLALYENAGFRVIGRREARGRGRRELRPIGLRVP